MLVFGGCGSAVLAATFPQVGIGLVGVSLAFGLTVLTMAYAVGRVSGGHFNPAVTIGLFTARRIPADDIVPYIIAQAIGAIAAAGVLLLIASGKPGYSLTINGLAANGYGEHSPGNYTLLAGFVAETVLTFFFLLIILGSTEQRAPQGFAPISIGLALTLIHLISIPITNTSVNPARSLGPAFFVGGWALSQLWLFWIAPLLGAVLAGLVYPILARGTETYADAWYRISCVKGQWGSDVMKQAPPTQLWVAIDSVCAWDRQGGDYANLLWRWLCARQQTVCYCDSADDTLHRRELDHQKEVVRSFYAQLTDKVIVELEASGYSTCFIELLEGLGHQVLIGDATEFRRVARRRQKNDRRDASLILDLSLKGEFPQVHRPSLESREVLRHLRYRHKLVEMRTRAKNCLQALAFSAGSAGRSKLLRQKGCEQFKQIRMSAAIACQREEWLSLVDEINQRIKSLDAWLDKQARQDERVMRLQMHPGIRLLTSLALVHALEPVVRFAVSRKVAAYVGLEPMEYSSGDKQRFGSISKGGSRLLRYLLVEAAQITVRRDE
jgi:aquaporin Z